MKVAALDFGSNSFLCLIAQLDPSGKIQILSDQVEIVRLGKNLEATGFFCDESIAKAESTIKNFRKEIDRLKPEKILAVATAAARKVQDVSPLTSLATKYQIPLKIISGTEESRLTFAGSTMDYRDLSKDLLVIDIGGGSTELVLGCRGVIRKAVSTPVGCVNLTEKFSLSSSDRNSQIDVEFFLNHTLGPAIFAILKESDDFDIVAVAGTPTELARQALGEFDSEKINGYEITDQFLKENIKLMSGKSSEELTAIGFNKDRSEIILAGTYILNYLIQSLDKNKLRVSTKGLRYGVALDLFNNL
jgi:exopolyphosphatase/guanosine-5'-triphosphate,3'-diphosphate pyrophosphatase